jgi:predicted ATPase/class 3 adenylate cyclase
MQTSITPYNGTEPYIFVSYAHADESVVMAEMGRLKEMGLNIWYDAGIAPGSTWREEIAKSLAKASRMIFFVSKKSAHSIHCMQETSFSHTRGVKILAIHLEPVELPLGLELNLGDQQAIFKYQLQDKEYTNQVRSALTGLTAQPVASTATVSELKQVTVLHAQFRTVPVGDEPVDPESYLEAISECRAQISERIAYLEGHQSVTSNEELNICFGVPNAHEDDARRALRAALLIQEVIDRSRIEFARKYDLEIDIRQGIQSGRVVVRNVPGEGLSIFGQSSNDAAALAKEAESGQVYISAIVYQLVKKAFDCYHVGEQVLGSKSIDTYQVLKESLVPQQLDSSGFLRIVGREQELGSLLDRWKLAASGSGQAVLLSGEPGIGKSRLTMSLIDQIRDKGEVQVFSGICSPYFTHTSLHPFVGILEGILGLRTEMSNEEKFARLDEYLAGFELGEESPTRLFAKLLSISNDLPVPQTTLELEKQLLFESILNIAIQESQQRPVFLIIEDIHWADATTLELLGHLLDVLPTTHIFCLLNFRAYFNPEWAVRPHITQLALNRVTDEEASGIIRSVVGDSALDSRTMAKIISRADGVPLFLEEVTKSLLDSGALLEGATDLAIPITLQESLTARLDLLKIEKQVAQIASVIGREFELSLLSKIAPFGKTELNEYLTTLVRKDFVLQQGIGASARYIFKHALVRDTAYGSLMKKDRLEYHKRIAASLITEFPKISERRPELVAHHLSAVGDHQDALEWWLKAGDNAAQNFANREAEHHYRHALESIPHLEDSADSTELGILMRLVPTLVANSGYGSSELEQTCERALELCERVGDDAQTGFVLYGLWMFHVVRANHPQSLELATRVAKSAESMQNHDLIIEAALAEGIANFFVGEFEVARAQFDKCIALYDEEDHGHHAYLFGQDPRVIALSYMSWLLWITGNEDEAIEAGEAALTYARELGHPVSLAFALSYAAFLRMFQGDYHHDAGFAEELITLRESHGIPKFWVAHGNVALAWHRGAVHDAHEAAEQMRDALELFRDSGSRCFLPLWDAIHAEILIRADRTEEALEVLDKAEQEMAETGELWCLSEWHRVHAMAHHSVGKKEHTNKIFEEAANVAEQQGATNWLDRVESSRDGLKHE